jgi:hypothetical protein
MLERNGEDPTFLRDFQTALRGYPGFGERVAGDAIRKIDYVLCLADTISVKDSKSSP